MDKVNLRWNVAKVEQALVSQIDGFHMKKMRGNHSECDEIPCFPNFTKFLNSWNTEVWPRFG